MVLQLRLQVTGHFIALCRWLAIVLGALVLVGSGVSAAEASGKPPCRYECLPHVSVRAHVSPTAESMADGALSTSVASLVYRLAPGTGSGVGPESDWPQLSGILRDAARGKGNFGLGTATTEQADAAGMAWVGENPTLASDGKTWVS